MPLIELPLAVDERPMPADVLAFLREADQRIEDFQRQGRVPGFVPSDFVRVYSFLRALADAQVAPGPLFCEWGSGFGVNACLAAMLGFEAVGIEIDGGLVDAARSLADDFQLSVEFLCGSFIPRGGAIKGRVGDGFAWLATDESRTDLGVDPSDFDVIFAYPWPGEEQATGQLFDRFANAGALLVTYHSSEEMGLRRKVDKKGRRAR